MKTRKNLFEKITNYENIYLAYLKARKAKRFKQEILEFTFNLESNLLKLQEELEFGKYKHRGYKVFYRCDLKKRLIKAASFRDRVVHHALCNIIEPIFDKTFIYDSYACRKNKGSHAGVKRLKKFILKNPNFYCLKSDVRKYFGSINHGILLNLIKHKIKDEKVINLVSEIINGSSDSPGRGIPIGNLTSQLFANIYLNELDYFVKHKLKAKYYIRYVDDFVILHKNKEKLHSFKKQIRNYLSENLELEIPENKTSVFPVRDGIDFLGFRTYIDKIKIRKSTVKHFINQMKLRRKLLEKGKISIEKYMNFLESFNVHARHANSYRLRQSLILKYNLPELECLMRKLK